MTEFTKLLNQERTFEMIKTIALSELEAIDRTNKEQLEKGISLLGQVRYAISELKVVRAQMNYIAPTSRKSNGCEWFETYADQLSELWAAKEKIENKNEPIFEWEQVCSFEWPNSFERVSIDNESVRLDEYVRFGNNDRAEDTFSSRAQLEHKDKYVRPFRSRARAARRNRQVDEHASRLADLAFQRGFVPNKQNDRA